MNIRIRLVGGPVDGQSMTIPNLEPPPLYLIPVPRPLAEALAEMMTAPLAPSPIPVAEYELQHENGWPRRDGNGVYLYKHRAAPLTPETRQAAASAREERRTAEAEREAILDGIWEEIRQERPHYPTDWRDLPGA